MHRSSNKPDVVTANLIKSNIIVDSIILGEVVDNPLLRLSRQLSNTAYSSRLGVVDNNILRGISNATGVQHESNTVFTQVLKMLNSQAAHRHQRTRECQN